MKVLFFNPHARSSPVFEWGLDIIQRHLDAGDSVISLVCSGELASCEINPQHRFSVCNKCTVKCAAGYGLLSGNFSTAPILKLTGENVREIEALPKRFETLDGLKQFLIDGQDLGMAVASSVISLTRDPYPDLHANAALIHNLLCSTLAVYRSIQNRLIEGAFDRVYVFNARVSIYRAAFHAARSRNVECHVFENGGTIDRFQRYINRKPLDIGYNEQLIREAWEQAAPADRERAGRDYFEKAVRGKTMLSYIGAQREKLLPEGFNPDEHNIAVFGSSEDELAAIGKEWNNPIYRDQLDALKQIRADIDALPRNVRLYLRMHPHLRGVDNRMIRELKALNDSRFVVIPPESPVSSYALLRVAKTVVTFGSSMGMEAVYHGIPSILIARSVYRNLGGTYNPATHDELMKLLQTELAPKPLEAALVFGNFCSTYGEPFKYYQADSYTAGSFKGVRVGYGKWRDYAWGVFDRLPFAPNLLNRRHLRNALKKIAAVS